MIFLRIWFLSACLLLLSGAASHAVLISNGNFASGLTGYTAVGATGTATSYSGISPTSGSRLSWMRSTGGVGVSTIESTLGLSSGSLQSLSNSLTHPYRHYSLTNGSAMTTSFNGTGALTFDWNFWRDDYVPYNDISFFTISGPGITGSQVVLLSDVNGSAQALATTTGQGVGNRTGWQGYSYALPGTGVYTIGFGVVNSRDTVIASYLHIDNIQASSLVPEASQALTAMLLTLTGFGLAVRRRRPPERV